VDFQGTLFDGEVSGVPAPVDAERTTLTRGAWVECRRNWLPDADDVFATMMTEVPWRAERRQMYDRVVDVPRLVHTYAVGETLPHHTLEEARDALSAHYRPILGEPFVTAGCCYYRDGQDCVAWHGDRIGRGRSHDTMVAIVSLGDPRRLALRPRREAAADGETKDSRNLAAELRGRHEPRPRGGGESLSFELGHGDLLVMGGSCQRTWEHAVPKVAHAGPRMSVQFRPLNVF
jgi:alkylated DNA repair dioxygenase AlkB